MSTSTKYKELVLLLLLCVVAPSYAQICSCEDRAFPTNRNKTIESFFCSEFTRELRC